MTSTLLSNVRTVSDYGNFILGLEQLFGLTNKGELTGLGLFGPGPGGLEKLGTAPLGKGFGPDYAETTQTASAWLPADAGKLSLTITILRLSDKMLFTGSVSAAMTFCGI